MRTDYELGAALSRVAKSFGRDFYTVRRALVSQGVQIRRKTKTLRAIDVTDEEARKMRVDYENGASLAMVGKIFDRSSCTVRRALVARGVELRSPPRMSGFDRKTGRFLRRRRLTDEQIECILRSSGKIFVHPDLRWEWRLWSLKRRTEYVRRLREYLQLEEARPETPFSSNVEPFDYGSRRARTLAAALNGRQPGNSIRLVSQGVIWEGELWFWVTKTGYCRGGTWTRAEGRPLLNRAIWEAEHGTKVPPGCVVRCADGNPNNLDPANLVLATRNDLARENQAAHLNRTARALTSSLLKMHQSPDHSHARTFLAIQHPIPVA